MASPPSRGAWIEIRISLPSRNVRKSPPSRGAWIEIYSRIAPMGGSFTVAPLAGGVD